MAIFNIAIPNRASGAVSLVFFELFERLRSFIPLLVDGENAQQATSWLCPAGVDQR